MELEAREVHPRSNHGATPNHLGDLGHRGGDSFSSAISSYTDEGQEFRPFDDGQKSYRPMADFEEPSNSPFPRIKGDNIPPSDKEKEEILYNAREHVLHSTNVSMQLSWARDCLNYVETAADVRERDQGDSYGARPSTPRVEHDLRVDAMNIVRYLAEQNHPEAVFMKAKWEEFGKFGERQDKKTAFREYARAAQQGWGRAEYRMGMLYETSSDFDKAIYHYQNGERLGDSAAKYRLGMMALLGQHGQIQDIMRGVDLIKEAADTADEDAPQGAYVFGMLIARDLPDIEIREEYLPYNVETARQYIEKAAYLGFAKAQLKMGQAYELCQLGRDFNPAYSLHYYGLAAAQGQPEAALGVSRWFLFGYDGHFAKNEALAFKYARQAAVAKLATGEFAMGYYHEIGIHVPKNLPEARRWYEKAAANGNTDAVKQLEALNKNKSLSKADHETTALSRIKSQHGSMRGKRPERLQRMKDQQHMAALPESGPGTPTDANRRSPRVSPNQLPRHGPSGADGRPPAFGLNVSVDHGNLAMRPKSAAPYPEDDHRPQLLNTNRPRSAVPYPEDDYNRGPQQQHPHAGLPPPGRLDAYGARPGSAGRMGPGPNNLAPGIVPAGMPPPAGGRGRAPSAAPYPPGGPGGPPGGQHRHGSMGGGNMGGGPSPGYGPRPMGGSAANGTDFQLQGSYSSHSSVSSGSILTNPNTYPAAAGRGQYGNIPPAQQSPTMIPPAGSMPAGQPYGARPGSRAGTGPAPGSAGPPRHDSHGGAMVNRFDSPGLPSGPKQPSQAQPGRPPVSLSDNGGRSSAPPAQVRPSTASPAPSAAPSSASAATVPAAAKPAKPAKKPMDHPDGKTTGNGPATFDEMGIARVKDKDDCVRDSIPMNVSPAVVENPR